MRYAMLIIGDESYWDAQEPSQRDATMSEIFAWFEKWEAAGKIADGGAELANTSEAKTVRAGTISDGPYIEAKEVIGGITFLEADTIDEAADIAASWPGVAEGRSTIEVRPIIEH